jgi:hypothetical protein
MRSISRGVKISGSVFLRRFDNIHPLPVFIQHMFVKKLEAITINFNGTPIITFHEVSEVIL